MEYQLHLEKMNDNDWIAVFCYSEWIWYNTMTGFILLWYSLNESVTDFWMYLYSGTFPIYIGQYRSPGWGEISRILISYSLNMLSSVGFAVATVILILGGTIRDMYVFAFVPFAFQFANYWAIDRVGHLNNLLAKSQTLIISIGLIFVGISTYRHQVL